LDFGAPLESPAMRQPDHILVAANAVPEGGQTGDVLICT